MYCLTRLFCKTTKFSPAMVYKEQIPIDKEDGRELVPAISINESKTYHLDLSP